MPLGGRDLPELEVSLLCCAGYREACELAYKELESVCLNNSHDPQRFRQVRALLYYCAPSRLRAPLQCRSSALVNFSFGCA